MMCKLILIFCLANHALTLIPPNMCYKEISYNAISSEEFTKLCVPPLEGKVMGDSGRIGIIGGSSDATGAPFFAAMAALTSGADLVYVITPESAAPAIQSYSPDLLVYPILHFMSLPKIKHLIAKIDTIVIGPGFGRDEDSLALMYEIIHICKRKLKPLIIDGDGLYAISRNISIIDQYPSPGVILTPNRREAEKLELSVPARPHTFWAQYWGDFVSVLVKGKNDTFFSPVREFGWYFDKGGSPRRTAGQGDILAGALGTFYHWGIKADVCSNMHSIQLAQSLASAAAANLTRIANALAFHTYGRSMTASDMLKEIHKALNILMFTPLPYVDYRFSS